MRLPFPPLTPQGRWCPSCGVTVSNDAEVCPHCGLPLENVPVPIEASQEASEITGKIDREELISEEESAADTRTIPRIESAIPSEDDPNSKAAMNEGIPGLSRFVFAAVAALLFVCGIALAITHPWDRSVHSIRATEEADTSMAGFPGIKESLSGQDTGKDGGKDEKKEIVSGDETTFQKLEEAHTELGKLSERADESQKRIYDSGFSGTDEEREAGRDEAEQLAFDVSNLISELEKVDVTSGVYVDERKNLLTLANWLRNRVDVLYNSWRELTDAEDPAEVRAGIEAKIGPKDAATLKGSYAQLFAESYDDYKPQRKETDGQEGE